MEIIFKFTVNQYIVKKTVKGKDILYEILRNILKEDQKLKDIKIEGATCNGSPLDLYAKFATLKIITGDTIKINSSLQTKKNFNKINKIELDKDFEKIREHRKQIDLRNERIRLLEAQVNELKTQLKIANERTKIDLNPDLIITNEIELIVNINEFNIGKDIHLIHNYPINYQPFIRQIRIDNKRLDDITNSYKFKKLGNHKINIEFNRVLKVCKEMFYNCKFIKIINLSKFDSSLLTSIHGMFCDCNELEEIKGLDNFHTEKITDMRGIFINCYKLKSLNLKSFNTKNVIDMHKMFYNCIELEKIEGVSDFNIGKLKNYECMFDYCDKLPDSIKEKFKCKKTKK